jgi:hypothetical protein
MNPNNIDLEKALNELPELLSKSFEKWRIAGLDLERFEALMAAKIRGENQGIKATEVRDKINADDNWYQLRMDVIKAESYHNLIENRLLSAKKMASLRTAF